ncbi:hypothetical protein ASPZODRAFT_127431 [Penicilliopsis zonata CBS 506.65]|uniref:RING-type E3 ubiquitin transferase n=1 Tax=Penicilliopsis zonata CBS 506.65 TaxID=1073090 RepID=A0A1L9SWD5_9EURO|nr:hypothetical protein ASPZODRAFT_127431 [Penicilliopsis zonata CBS 506.65]OJJ51363.1 hypothetical protein ASPZODRAFT_127431 [Penicilliopsis zonata CBS 506.65]
MRPPRLIFLVFCFIFFPIFLTFFSFCFSSPRVTTPSALPGRTGGLHALFSFNIPSSLFPPSAIISLTDDNSTFFLARPAAFGPLLPSKGLSGQLWVGSGFGEGGAITGIEGELGCSDIPGWGESENHRKQDKSTKDVETASGKSVSSPDSESAKLQNRRRSDSQQDAKSPIIGDDKSSAPSMNDGTDDHLHHPLLESGKSDSSASDQHGDHDLNKVPAHADIQSLQESAEIAGKVVLLSRGGCGFLEKVKWAQRRGGIAVIVGDDTRGGSLVTMYARGDTSNITIPAIFTSHTTAHLLSSLIPQQIGATTTNSKSTPADSSKQDSGSKTRTSSLPSPTSTISTTSRDDGSSTPKTGFFRTIFSFLGLGDDADSWYGANDNWRPPSSGNIDWITMDSWDDEDSSLNAMSASSDYDRDNVQKLSKSKKSGSTLTGPDSDDFIIGVQDWRDPDLVAPKSSVLPQPSSTAKDKTNYKSGSKDSLKGGSITPGSGEYELVDKSSAKSKDSGTKMSSQSTSTSEASNNAKPGWFSSHFSWLQDKEPMVDGPSGPEEQKRPLDAKTQKASSSSRNHQSLHKNEHEGLWVTLTPTSMSTSPFFDTLLVLVVSPLLTLTAVYALLLLRSRIRRRRWRAPKSVVDRLPVRTYHTISRSSSSTTTTTTTTTSSPNSSSPASPLLGSENRTGILGCRPRSQTISGIVSSAPDPNPVSPPKEKLASGSTLWRRKYTGRQVECVVCLEEYVDGQSRVMSLPCGHEFHAECITPWLTTRRRTCPICKGDVVRSLAQTRADESREQTGERVEAPTSEARPETSSSPVAVSGFSGDLLNPHAGADVNLLERHASSAPQSGLRNLASMSYSMLSGDGIWHQTRNDRNR